MTTAAPSPVARAAGSQTGEVLSLQNATRMYGGFVAVRDVTLTVAPGTILGLIGPSGAGKTTTIRLLTGGIAPTRGTVRVLGEDPRKFRRRTRERIGYMPQQFTLYPDLTAAENLNFVASLFGMLWLRRRRRVREVLKAVELWDARDRRASDLSGGMQRRLELACTLVHEPSLLFLDEPTGGLDPLLRARVWEELHRLKETGRTFLVTTQYLNEAEECDRVALITEGHLVALDSPDDLRRKATGGDIIEVQTASRFSAAKLASLPQVRGVSQQGPQTFRVTVDEAGAATPDVVAAVAAAGGEVAYAREYRPSFDEVFAELVGREREAVEQQRAEALQRSGASGSKADADVGEQPKTAEAASDATAPQPTPDQSTPKTPSRTTRPKRSATRAAATADVEPSPADRGDAAPAPASDEGSR